MWNYFTKIFKNIFDTAMATVTFTRNASPIDPTPDSHGCSSGRSRIAIVNSIQQRRKSNWSQRWISLCPISVLFALWWSAAKRKREINSHGYNLPGRLYDWIVFQATHDFHIGPDAFGFFIRCIIRHRYCGHRKKCENVRLQLELVWCLINCTAAEYLRKQRTGSNVWRIFSPGHINV